MEKSAEKRIADDTTGKRNSFIFNSFGSNNGCSDLASVLIKRKREIKKIVIRESNFRFDIPHFPRCVKATIKEQMVITRRKLPFLSRGSLFPVSALVPFKM